MLRSWILFLLAITIPATAAADSLVAAARRERERRAKIAKASGRSQVLTNKSLPSSSGHATLNRAAVSVPASTAQAQAEARKKSRKDKDEWSEWRKRFADARQAIEDRELELDAARSRAGVLRMGMTYGDPQDFNQKAQTDQALQGVGAAEKALDDAKQALRDLQEEARRAGVPASVRR